MPCTDGGVPYPKTNAEKLEAKVPAMLCALLRTFATAKLKDVTAEVNWAEAGVTEKEFYQWWAAHSAKDISRLRRAALKKLTLAEKAALGLQHER